MIKNFQKICRMSQSELKGYVARRLTGSGRKVIIGDGYVYSQGDFPVLLVAHLDTVHHELPNVIYYDKERDELSSPNGIGGDDRCGVYMIFEIIKHFNCSVLFCEDEEKGGIGVGKFVKTELAKELEFNYAIEFDRKGNNDAVFYDCDNKEFEEFITKDFYETNYGSYSDICTLAPVLGCAAVNLSCGYHMAHTKSEYVVLNEMEKSIAAACAILERTTENDKFEYVERKDNKWGKWGSYNNCYSGWSNCYYSDFYGYEDEDDIFGQMYEDKYHLIEYYNHNTTEWDEIYAVNEDEAVGKFMKDHPNLTYNNIIAIYKEDEEVK